ncbi:MAG: hypothetical protein IPN76_33355 [Saprospiraceae bacterium]|nr:hypothetical protein [Saprospiraceae bacterium]
MEERKIFLSPQFLGKIEFSQNTPVRQFFALGSAVRFPKNFHGKKIMCHPSIHAFSKKTKTAGKTAGKIVSNGFDSGFFLFTK